MLNEYSLRVITKKIYVYISVSLAKICRGVSKVSVKTVNGFNHSWRKNSKSMGLFLDGSLLGLEAVLPIDVAAGLVSYPSIRTETSRPVIDGQHQKVPRFADDAHLSAGTGRHASAPERAPRGILLSDFEQRGPDRRRQPSLQTDCSGTCTRRLPVSLSQRSAGESLKFAGRHN